MLVPGWSNALVLLVDDKRRPIRNRLRPHTWYAGESKVEESGHSTWSSSGATRSTRRDNSEGEVIGDPILDCDAHSDLELEKRAGVKLCWK